MFLKDGHLTRKNTLISNCKPSWKTGNQTRSSYWVLMNYHHLPVLLRYLYTSITVIQKHVEFLIPTVWEAPLATYFRYGNWDMEGNQVHISCKERSVDSILSPLVCQQITPGTQEVCGRNGNQSFTCQHSYNWTIQILLPQSTIFTHYTLVSSQDNEMSKCTCRQGLDSWNSMTGNAIGNTERESSVFRSQPHFRPNTFKYKPVLLRVVCDIHSPPYIPPSTSLSLWAVLHPAVSSWTCSQTEEGQMLCSAG